MAFSLPEIILYLLIAIIGGFIIGFLGVKLQNFITNYKLRKMARNVLNGTRKNQIEINGQFIDAYVFKTRDDEGNEEIIDLRKINNNSLNFDDENEKKLNVPKNKKNAKK